MCCIDIIFCNLGKIIELDIIVKQFKNHKMETIKKLSGKIILVDDEKYEKKLLELSLKKRGWDVVMEYFSNPEVALEYLKNTKDEIFLIISDMNMSSKMNGLDFKKEIDKSFESHKKSIPFIFSSSADQKEEIEEAFLYRVQGYFKKPMDINEQAEMFNIIIRYWIISNHPYKGSIVENANLI
jgi:response regulator RpfG family c-di-GMP phosphodiesterase